MRTPIARSSWGVGGFILTLKEAETKIEVEGPYLGHKTSSDVALIWVQMYLG